MEASTPAGRVQDHEGTMLQKWMETVGIAQDGRPLFKTGVLQDCANVRTGIIVEVAVSGHE
jgi:hypothetical protein